MIDGRWSGRIMWCCLGVMLLSVVILGYGLSRSEGVPIPGPVAKVGLEP